MRRTAGAALAALLLVAACASPAPPREAARRNPCDGRVIVQGRREADRSVVEARNDCFVPVEVTIRVEDLRNLQPSRESPVTAVVGPHQSAELVELRALDPRQPSAYRVRDGLRVGGEPHPDPQARYAFPFGGDAPRPLTQGVGGPETHTGLHRFAFDFAMPVGTPVLAARPGVVFRVVDGFGAGGPDADAEQGNLVAVWQADGTFATYGHLRKGLCVREGESVETGALLGFSGSSGRATGPHLHFEVGVLAGESQELESVPIRFVGDLVPRVGASYAPQAARETAASCG